MSDTMARKSVSMREKEEQAVPVDEQATAPATEETPVETPVETNEEVIDSTTEVKEQIPVNSPMPTLTDLSKQEIIIEQKAEAICDMVGLTEDEKMMLLKARIEKIFSSAQIQNPPAMVKYQLSPTQPYVLGLVDADCTCVKQAWDYFSTNVEQPEAIKFLELVKEVTGKAMRVYPRVVEVNLC